MTGTPLFTVLHNMLGPHGFTSKKTSGKFVRETASTREVVGFRKSRTGGGESAVYFELTGGPSGSGQAYELSPVVPLKNTYWWPAVLTAEEAAILTAQLQTIALRYFDAWSRGFSPDQAESALHGRLRCLLEASPPMRRQGNLYWRQRADILDVVEIEPLAGGVFAFVYVAVWHRLLADGFDPERPGDATRVASTTLSGQSVDPYPNATLIYLGPDAGTSEALDSLGTTALQFLARIGTRDDVLLMIREDYRNHYSPPPSAA
jgi:hypothetical protein